MNSILMGWKVGGRSAARLAVVYMMLACLAYYLQMSGSGGARWQPKNLMVADFVGSGFGTILAVPFLLVIPLGLAWLCGSVGGFMTGLLAPLLGNKKLARWWGMFCFFVPSLIFHNAAELRPQIVLGGHWLNAYWFWIGLPTVITVVVGGWVGEQLAGSERQRVVG